MKEPANDNTMTLHALNVRGVRDIETELGGLTLIGGRNGAGKTSLAQAIAAAVTGLPPIQGLKKSELHLLLRAGTARGEASISSPAGRVTFTLPDGKVTSEGRPPQATPYAAGVLSVVDLPTKQASEALAAYIDAVPRLEDLRAALPDLPESALTIIWRDVEATGWDGAHANAKENGAIIKGRWEQITGQRYGVKKAAGWMPEKWSYGLENATEEQLAATLAEAETSYADAIKAAAVTGHERARLGELAERLDMREESARKAQEGVAAAEATYGAAKSDLDALPPLDGSQGVPCPHCGGLVEIRGRALAEFTGEADPGARAAREAARAEATTKADKAKADLYAARGDVQRALANVEESRAAAASLAEMPTATGGEFLDAEQAQSAAETARANLDAFKARREATKFHEQILAYAAVVAALSPDGVRATKLSKALATFNTQLAALCAVAEFPAVRMESDLSVSYGDRAFLLLSESEQYRARAVIQSAMAKHDGSALVIFDRADLLDKDGRNGLMRLALHLGLPAVVCMTANGPEALPNLADKGMGRTIWLTSGEAA